MYIIDTYMYAVECIWVSILQSAVMVRVGMILASAILGMPAVLAVLHRYFIEVNLIICVRMIVRNFATLPNVHRKKLHRGLLCLLLLS